VVYTKDLLVKRNNEYDLEFEIKNIKSHYGTNGLKFKVSKPITVIAGPNGEGKSNLLEAMLYGIGKYIQRSNRLKLSSSFLKEVVLSNNPRIKANLADLVFKDNLLRGLRKKKMNEVMPERLSPSNMVSYGKRSGSIEFKISRVSDQNKRVILSSSELKFGKGKISGQKNFKK